MTRCHLQLIGNVENIRRQALNSREIIIHGQSFVGEIFSIEGLYHYSWDDTEFLTRNSLFLYPSFRIRTSGFPKKIPSSERRKVFLGGKRASEHFAGEVRKP
jgi:hypothetical protein